MLNSAQIIGHLGQDPETRFTTSGKAVCSFSVATTEKWKGDDGELKESTQWHKVVVWGKQAEPCGQYLAKGRMVYVEGRIQTRSYDNKDGVKVYVTEIIARNVKFLGGGKDREKPAGATTTNDDTDAGDDHSSSSDLPF